MNVTLGWDANLKAYAVKIDEQVVGWAEDFGEARVLWVRARKVKVSRHKDGSIEYRWPRD